MGVIRLTGMEGRVILWARVRSIHALQVNTCHGAGFRLGMRISLG